MPSEFLVSMARPHVEGLLEVPNVNMLCQIKDGRTRTFELFGTPEFAVN